MPTKRPAGATFGIVRVPPAFQSPSATGEVEFTNPPNPLSAKLGARFGGIDAAAIARAEAALQSLSSQFDGWLKDEVEKLEAAHRAVHAAGATAEGMNALYIHAHDLKGLGGTYGFPLISRVAGSLCKLMDGPGGRGPGPLSLVDAHVDAVRAMVRGDIRAADHPTGLALAQALEGRMADYAAAQPGASPAR